MRKITSVYIVDYIDRVQRYFLSNPEGMQHYLSSFYILAILRSVHIDYLAEGNRLIVYFVLNSWAKKDQCLRARLFSFKESRASMNFVLMIRRI